jgi:hypothetical protein
VRTKDAADGDPRTIDAPAPVVPASSPLAAMVLRAEFINLNESAGSRG